MSRVVSRTRLWFPEVWAYETESGTSLSTLQNLHQTSNIKDNIMNQIIGYLNNNFTLRTHYSRPCLIISCLIMLKEFGLNDKARMSIWYLVPYQAIFGAHFCVFWDWYCRFCTVRYIEVIYLRSSFTSFVPYQPLSVPVSTFCVLRDQYFRFDTGTSTASSSSLDKRKSYMRSYLMIVWYSIRNNFYLQINLRDTLNE
ncbi:hypothetical protein HanIR_Chr07g0317801 [Helianthus annuus]|nr:hypothetical protein HanIR_Chr07g0317801 [Helianthus annuus]